MTNLQNARVQLWKAMKGRVIPGAVLKDMKTGLDPEDFCRFCKIYADENINLILAANALNENGYVQFWSEVFPEVSPDYNLIAFLLSEKFAKLKTCWQDELACLVMNVGETTGFEALHLLGNLLFFNGSCRAVEKWFEKLVTKLADMPFDFDVYLAYCLIALKFRLMTEDLLPTFFEAFEKHKGEFDKAHAFLSQKNYY